MAASSDLARIWTHFPEQWKAGEGPPTVPASPASVALASAPAAFSCLQQDTPWHPPLYSGPFKTRATYTSCLTSTLPGPWLQGSRWHSQQCHFISDPRRSDSCLCHPSPAPHPHGAHPSLVPMYTKAVMITAHTVSLAPGHCPSPRHPKSWFPSTLVSLLTPSCVLAPTGWRPSRGPSPHALQQAGAVFLARPASPWAERHSRRTSHSGLGTLAFAMSSPGMPFSTLLPHSRVPPCRPTPRITSSGKPS